MEYRKFGSDYVVRIDRGEEILESLQKVCENEGILLGTVTGIGAVDDVTLGLFNFDTFEYESYTYKGEYEIVSCMGNISTMEGKNYLHLHMAVSNITEGLNYSGHLNRGVISLTGEFMIHKIDGSVDRKYSDSVGLNLIEFTKD